MYMLLYSFYLRMLDCFLYSKYYIISSLQCQTNLLVYHSLHDMRFPGAYLQFVMHYSVI